MDSKIKCVGDFIRAKLISRTAGACRTRQRSSDAQFVGSFSGKRSPHRHLRPLPKGPARQRGDCLMPACPIRQTGNSQLLGFGSFLLARLFFGGLYRCEE